MRLVEIVRGDATADEVLATALAFAKRLGKVGVVVRNGPGFVGNRMMFPYMYEAQFLAEEGATPEQVDGVLTDWGMAMGIFAVDDMGGLDVAWRVRQELHQFEEPGARKPLVADKLVEMGRLGQKTGKGWYRYGGDRKPIPDPEVIEFDRIGRFAAAGIRRRPISDEEILERTIYALINEGARVLEEGVALARRRHRRHLPDRLRLSRLSRRPDVLRRHRRAAARSTSAIAAFHREHGAALEAGAAARAAGARGVDLPRVRPAEAVEPPSSRSSDSTRPHGARGRSNRVRRTWRSATARMASSTCSRADRSGPIP